MTVINEKDVDIVNVYFCPTCRRYFNRNSGLIRCGVMHKHGSCCHYLEKELSEEIVDKLLEILKGA